MAPVAYYSLIYNNRVYERFPSFRMLDQSGNPSRTARTEDGSETATGRYGWLCPNNPGYRDYVRRELTELFAAYDFPGIFLDFSTATHPWTFGVRACMTEYSDYCGGDLYGGFEEQSFICKLYYTLTKNQPFEYMTSRCDPDLHDHTTTKSEDMLRLHACLTYAHHGAFLAIDAIDPDGTLNTDFYRTLGRVFRETEQLEPFLCGTLQADAAIFFHSGRKYTPEKEQGRPAQISSCPAGPYPHLRSALGISKALSHSHILYRVLTEYKTDFSDVKVVILPAGARPEEGERAALAAFVKGGGALYLSGDASPELAQQLLGLHICGRTREEVTYMAPVGDGVPLFAPAYSAEHPMTVFSAQLTVECTMPQQVLATITLPYTDPADRSVFASIHSNPPGRKTNMPAILSGTYGKGKVLWTSASFEESEQPEHRRICAALVGFLCGDNLTLKTNAHPAVECTLFDDPVQRVMLVHCVHVQNSFPALCTDPFTLTLHTPAPIRRIERLPGRQTVPFSQQGDTVTFSVPSLRMFDSYRLKY